MKNISTGAGLAILGLGIAAHPILSGIASSAVASVSSAPVAAAVTTAASTQAGAPTVVWYGVGPGASGNTQNHLYRAWSDGTVEARLVVNVYNPNYGICGFQTPCPWSVISSPTEGFKAAADSNADEKVDGEDLAAVLSNWGDAPRVPFPPSDCPLNLVNP